MPRFARLALGLSLTLAGVPLAAQQLTLPAGAILTAQEVETLGRYDLPLGPFAQGVLPVDRGEGQVTRAAWRIDGATEGTLAVLVPLRADLIAEGFAILFDCDGPACGGFDFRFATPVLAPPAMHVDLGHFRFLSARRGQERVGILVSAAPRAVFVQIIRVGPADGGFVAQPAGAAAPFPPDSAPDPAPGPAPRSDPAATAPEAPLTPVSTPPAPVAPGDLAARLESDGRVILSDLAFPTGSAQLAEGDFASLAALAAYLRANPGRRVALVGHTDAQGALEANIALSRRRAGSVMERLVSAYGVPRQQIAAEGMGYLAPVASNLTEAGRQANRRVEVIVTSTE